jgi:hypothetical protein
MTHSAHRAALFSSFCVVVAILCGGCGWHETCPPSWPCVYPLGAVNGAHYDAMHANGQAGSFIMHQFEFISSTAELSAAGKDHILEIAAKARWVPFRIVIERTENNANPMLDEHRRASIAQVLLDLGIADAQQRTIVAAAPSTGLAGRDFEAQSSRE